MDYKKTAIIYTARSNDKTVFSSLEQAGFCLIKTIAPEDSMRDAFRDILSGDCDYIVTVDEKDGFPVADILKVADAVVNDSSAVYVGKRSCTKEKGNLPAALFSFLSGINASDMDSSLIGMSRPLCEMMATMKSKEKAFFTNILLEARAQSVPIKEVETTVCYDNQPGFELLTRSFKLYFVFIKFSIAATIAYIVDIGTFYMFEQVFHAFVSEQKILFSTVLSRILCSIATYILNKGAVFKSQARATGAVVRFIIMSAVQLIASWLLVWGIGSLLGGSDVTNMLLKVVVDLVIFMISFPIQRDWVFKESDHLLN